MYVFLGQRDSIVGRTLVFHEINLVLNLCFPYDFPSHNQECLLSSEPRVIPEHYIWYGPKPKILNKLIFFCKMYLLLN